MSDHPTPAKSKERPYIILTLRRTGGTSLSTFLGSCSQFPKVIDEPFNTDRDWGDVSKMASTNAEPTVLREQVMKCLANRPVLKHCLEIIPPRLNQILIECCSELGYTFFVLTRRNEIGRIISLTLARATGAWGSAAANIIYPEIRSGKLKPNPINVDQAVSQVHSDAANLGRVLKMLRHRRIDYEWLIYEEVYNNPESTKQIAIRLAQQIGAEISHNDPRLDVLSASGNQNTAQIDNLFPEIDRLRSMLQNVCIE